MIRRLFTLLPFLLSAALAFGVSGEVTGELPKGARVGAWLVDSAGRPLSEVASAPVVGGGFSLNLPDSAPGGRALWPLTADTLAWPGVTGGVKLPGGVQSGELRLFVYGDANGNGRRDEGEDLLEGEARLGKASVVLTYLDRPANVTAGRGFAAALGAGWNILTIELGKTLRAGVQGSISGLRLSVAR